jgi:hypothetical protein
MKTIKIIIGRSEDHLAAYAPDVWGVPVPGKFPQKQNKQLRSQ